MDESGMGQQPMISEELLQSFIAEASDLLDDAEPSLVEYPRRQEIEDRTEIVNRVFRHFHSIKGSAGFVGLHDIARLTHEAETLLEQYRKMPERMIPQEDITLLCRTVDFLRAIFANGGDSVDADGKDLGLDALILEIVNATRNAKHAASPNRPVPAGGIHILDAEETQVVNQEDMEVMLSRTSVRDALHPDDSPSESGDGADERPEPDKSSHTEQIHRPKEKKDGTDGKTSRKEKKSDDTAQASTVSSMTRTRRASSDTARVIKGSQLAKQDKFSAGDFAMRYVGEANELLEQIEQSLLHAEQHPDSSAEAIQEALRCLHSFKGNSGFMNLTDLERLSHRMESEVETQIGRTIGIDSQTFDVLLQMIDVLRQGVHDFSIGGSGRIVEADSYIELMDQFSAERGVTGFTRPPTEILPGFADSRKTAAANPGDTAKPAANQAGILEIKPIPDKNAGPTTESGVRNENETRRIGKPVREPSDTTRMVLRGVTSAQENLLEMPRAESIVIAADPAPESPSPTTGSATEKSVAPPQQQPSPPPKAKPLLSDTAKIANTDKMVKKDTSKSSDTTHKRKAGEQAAVRNDIRVDLRKLDNMLDLVGELVIAEAMVTRHPVVWNADNESLERAVHQLRRVAGSLQDMATSVRMIPLAPTFRRMTRLVYDLSVKAGKQVDLVLLGEDTEVDRTVIERISDPMVHIIRNAIDHGIESPEERRRRGKPDTGRLTIEGHHEGGEVWIVITDDGRGLDKRAILSRAISKGLIQGDGGDLTDREIYHFIFEPGFSTADKVTDISGRGFGMDVVKKNIEKLSGRIDIQTRPGEGTAVVMRIPLTLAIIDGMLVSSGDNRYIIPLLSIRESLRPVAEQIVTTPDGQEVLKLRGELIPVVKLGETFSRVSNAKTLLDGILMIVEGEDGDVVALFADELIGQQETVIKGLSGWLKKSRGVSGCTILGDGEVGLILDIGAIVRLTRERSSGIG